MPVLCPRNTERPTQLNLVVKEDMHRTRGGNTWTPQVELPISVAMGLGCHTSNGFGAPIVLPASGPESELLFPDAAVAA